MKNRWLDRRIAAPGPFLTLCLHESELHETLRRMKARGSAEWVPHGKGAVVHHLTSPSGKASCIVCLDGWQGRNPLEIAGLIVHESVHVWQRYCDDIGEHSPGREQEAYAIQAIAQELMEEFSRRLTDA